MLRIRTNLANGCEMAYSYDKIGNTPIREYMAEKQRQSRKKKRALKGKIILKDVSESTIQQMQNEIELGSSISAVSRKYEISWYMVKKCNQM